jgi:mannose-6-phosphate isomerase
MFMSVYKLTNPLQNYSWGSRTALSRLLGIPNPSDEPQAELWMGAHPKAPSRVLSGETGPALSLPLDELIARDPEALLGAPGASLFGGRLPYLFKVLSAAQPLSIQAHPSLGQARQGFEKEEEAGIPADAPHRNYKDPNHKPEILCALTPFKALWGFRSFDEIQEAFRNLGVPGELLSRKETIRSFFLSLMEMNSAAIQEMLEAAVKPGALPAGHSGAAWASRLRELYPGDRGALAPLYLNVVDLEPGEAIFIPSGELHAYLEGTGMELMANSDNVLRGGLTPKHVDIPELLAVLSFESREPERVTASGTPACTLYKVPAREFLLTRIALAGDEAALERRSRGAEIFLCLAGGVNILWAGGEMFLERGESVFIGADTGDYRLEGEGILFGASIPGEGGV